MNILVPDSWLREHLKTKATTAQIAEYLSLCSQSVEKMTKADEDVVYEIEVTTNRPDCLSVYGLARELATILPRFNIPARLKPIQHTTYLAKPDPALQDKIQNTKQDLPLHVQITSPSFCPRFTAVIFDNIKIKPSPKVVIERLEKSGIRALNNVVDISNYLMLELGQPMHTFDYDKILEHKMILREAKAGESLETLDGQVRKLPAGTIIIEDGKGRIIDLCGIMGGENSAVDGNTKRVLLFIQTYDPAKIRRTCQQMAFRTEAASRFEKSVDPEGVMIAMLKAIGMFEKNCEARVASKLIDIYPNPPKPKTVKLDLNLVEKIIGLEIPKKETIKILESLGFSLITNNELSGEARSRSAGLITIAVPHWRSTDVSIPEDLVEEIARIYGYFNLPTNLPEGQIPQQTTNKSFNLATKIKNALHYWGFMETYNYSMTSEQTLLKTVFNPKDSPKIANPLSEEGVYLRPSLLPSLLEVIAKNQDEFEEIKTFEVANIYLSQGKQELPQEKPKIAAVLTKSDFYQTKGIVEAVLKELEIDNYQMTTTEEGNNLFYHPHTAQIKKEKEILGIFGEINPTVSTSFGIKGKVFAFDLDFSVLAKLAKTIKKFQPLPKYPAIIEDLSFVVPPKTQVADLVQLIKSVSSIIKSVEFLNSYNETRTFRITYQSTQRTLNDTEIKEVRNRIIASAARKLSVNLKGS